MNLRWRIRSQLLVPVLLLLAGVVGVSIWTAIAAAERARQQIEERLRSVARFLSEEFAKRRISPEVLRMLKPVSGADYVLVRHGSEEPLGTLRERVVPPLDEVCDDWRQLRIGPPLLVEGRTYLCSGLRLHGEANAGDTLFILYPEALWRGARWEAVQPILILGGVVGLASVGLALGLGRDLSRRIHELQHRTGLIAAGDFSPLPLPGREDELRDLARSVNDMAQQLAQLQETVRRTERLRLLGQVSGGLVHQLRNGLTGIRLAVQLSLQEAAGRIDTAALEVALRQLTLLETHLKRFLDLGRGQTVKKAVCSLTALVTEAVDLLRPQCRHAGLTLHWQPTTDDTTLVGDAAQLGQMILNILGNAIEAAGPGGQVRVELQHDAAARRQVLTVTDSGPGPPAAIAERLFEPFVTGKPEGIGLGLAVARQAAEAHGGMIHWRRVKDQTEFRIELPERLP
jgi:signal transduction histidine kinase